MQLEVNVLLLFLNFLDFLENLRYTEFYFIKKPLLQIYFSLEENKLHRNYDLFQTEGKTPMLEVNNNSIFTFVPQLAFIKKNNKLILVYWKAKSHNHSSSFDFSVAASLSVSCRKIPLLLTSFICL